jgi:hypothetical protein
MLMTSQVANNIAHTILYADDKQVVISSDLNILNDSNEKDFYVRFAVLKAVTMKNATFCDVTQCGSSKNRHIR